LRIFEISSHQLQGWERAGLIPQQQTYTFQELGQLRTLRSLRAEDVSAASIRDSILAMKAVAGMANPLLEACLVRTGTRLAFRHRGAIMDPIRRQLLFDFERADRPMAVSEPSSPCNPGSGRLAGVKDRFLAAVQAEESGEKQRAIALYAEILEIDPGYAAAYINLGTIHFHARQYSRAEELYRRATEADPGYVLAFFDLGNVLALAYERKDEHRPALRHWQSYVKLDNRGPWADHARGQIRKLLSREKLAIAWRAERFIAPRKGMAALELVSEPAQ
jgi:tetratricopeptide (TPR) repeat protein